jgi:hypothetical protein
MKYSMLRALLEWLAEGMTLTGQFVNLSMRISKQHIEYQSASDRGIDQITCSTPAAGCSRVGPTKHITLFVLEPHVQCHAHG